LVSASAVFWIINNVAPSAEAMFVQIENSEIQRLMSIRMDGNQALNFAILTENSEINCKFLSIRTENSIYICV